MLDVKRSGQRCHGCDELAPVVFRIAGIPLCPKCNRIALGHVAGELGAPRDEIRAFVDVEIEANPRGPLVRGIVDAMYARCA